jgi:hypothetical protein
MLKISFNYNEETETIENLVVKNLNKKQPPTVEVIGNTLLLSKSSIELLECVCGDKISVQYTIDKSLIPVIGKASVFADEDTGNKLTKKNTVSFRGEQKKTLLSFGSKFYLQEFQEGMYKMIPVGDFDLQKVF